MPQPFVSLICAGRLRPWLAGAAIALGTFTARGDWQLVWSDEFNGVSIDTNHWKFEIGNHHGWGNHELEDYTDRPENVCVSNGVLHIIARAKPADGIFYTSARLKSQGLFAQKYGRFEFRAKLPGGRGYWPALWLMPEHSAYGRWPASGGIDVLENRGNDLAMVRGTLHFGSRQPQMVEYVFNLALEARLHPGTNGGGFAHGTNVALLWLHGKKYPDGSW
jgi:beta-glucanase (GH16 family)